MQLARVFVGTVKEFREHCEYVRKVVGLCGKDIPVKECAGYKLVHGQVTTVEPTTGIVRTFKYEPLVM